MESVLKSIGEAIGDGLDRANAVNAVDVQTIRQKIDRIADDLQSITSSIGGMAGSLTTLGSLSLELGRIADVAKEGMSGALKVTAVEVLRNENIKLIEDNSKLFRHNMRMSKALHDLGAPCIGCGKGANEFHEEGCEWAPKLEEVVDGEAEESEDAQEES